ncbi:methyltransferase domain-containing protein [Methylobacterium sp. BTF04]|uniref:class I SAM-dependent methyltransferase n=1 Tax=Methylobacterium sp. BTF04 TaxID=2708300 RepID=UPI0013CFC404|nr:class I SAM-dependent methyltransferase [Methylobacterium sp. BTF04]NEU14048.1 methyltransferase domain-containing protein [Methylobacterium sp. BTF04]
MTFQFSTPALNTYYDKAYDARECDWREVCAVDKADHIGALLGARRTEVETVVEVGCGTGDVVARLSSLGIGRRLVGIDIVDPALNNARTRHAANVSFLQQTGARLPFDDESTDLVVASHVLEHVECERAFLAELARISRRYLYVEVPCELHLRTRARDLQDTLEIGHINAYTPESFALTLATSGLRIVDIACFDHSLAVHAFHGSRLSGVVKRAVRSGMLRLHAGLAPKLFTYHCGALCTRA